MVGKQAGRTHTLPQPRACPLTRKAQDGSAARPARAPSPLLAGDAAPGGGVGEDAEGGARETGDQGAVRERGAGQAERRGRQGPETGRPPRGPRLPGGGSSSSSCSLSHPSLLLP